MKEAECLVKFGDNTVKWVALKNVTRMTCMSTITQFCNVCNIDNMPEDICVCDNCANAYHRKCHKVNYNSIVNFLNHFITFLK